MKKVPLPVCEYQILSVSNSGNLTDKLLEEKVDCAMPQRKQPIVVECKKCNWLL